MASKSKTTQTTTTDMGPWKVQTPYLTDTFQQAQNLYNETKATPGYQGDFYAGLNDTQRAAIDQGTDFFQNRGMGQANMLMDTGNSLLGSGAVGTGASALNLLRMGMEDPTQGNINAANAYAAGLDLDGLTDAAMYGARRQVSEDVLPTMYRANATTGNLNSDRAALAEGVVQRGLAENAQNIRSQLGAEAYNTGLQLAQGDAQQRAQNLAASGAIYDTMVGRGLTSADQGFTTAGQTGSAILDLQGLDQADRQAMLENNFQKQQYAETRPYDLLNRYYGIVGANNWGQQGTQTSVSQTKTTPSPMQIAGGVLGSLGSLFGGGGMLGGLGAFGKAGALGGFFGGKGGG